MSSLHVKQFVEAIFGGHGLTPVCRERDNTAVPRQIVADEGQTVDRVGG